MQLSDLGLEKLVELLEPVDAPLIVAYAERVQEHQARTHIAPANAQEFRTITWELILQSLLVDRGSEFNRKAFLKSNIAGLAQRFRIRYRELLHHLAVPAQPPRISGLPVNLPVLLRQLRDEEISESEHEFTTTSEDFEPLGRRAAGASSHDERGHTRRDRPASASASTGDRAFESSWGEDSPFAPWPPESSPEFAAWGRRFVRSWRRRTARARREMIEHWLPTGTPSTLATRIVTVFPVEMWNSVWQSLPGQSHPGLARILETAMAALHREGLIIATPWPAVRETFWQALFELALRSGSSFSPAALREFLVRVAPPSPANGWTARISAHLLADSGVRSSPILQHALSRVHTTAPSGIAPLTLEALQHDPALAFEVVETFLTRGVLHPAGVLQNLPGGPEALLVRLLLHHRQASIAFFRRSVADPDRRHSLVAHFSESFLQTLLHALASPIAPLLSAYLSLLIAQRTDLFPSSVSPRKFAVEAWNSLLKVASAAAPNLHSAATALHAHLHAMARIHGLDLAKLSELPGALVKLARVRSIAPAGATASLITILSSIATSSVPPSVTSAATSRPTALTRRHSATPDIISGAGRTFPQSSPPSADASTPVTPKPLSALPQQPQHPAPPTARADSTFPKSSPPSADASTPLIPEPLSVLPQQPQPPTPLTARADPTLSQSSPPSEAASAPIIPEPPSALPQRPQQPAPPTARADSTFPQSSPPSADTSTPVTPEPLSTLPQQSQPPTPLTSRADPTFPQSSPPSDVASTRLIPEPLSALPQQPQPPAPPTARADLASSRPPPSSVDASTLIIPESLSTLSQQPQPPTPLTARADSTLPQSSTPSADSSTPTIPASPSALPQQPPPLAPPTTRAASDHLSALRESRAARLSLFRRLLTERPLRLPHARRVAGVLTILWEAATADSSTLYAEALLAHPPDLPTMETIISSGGEFFFLRVLTDQPAPWISEFSEWLALLDQLGAVAAVFPFPRRELRARILLELVALIRATNTRPVRSGILMMEIMRRLGVLRHAAHHFDTLAKSFPALTPSTTTAGDVSEAQAFIILLQAFIARNPRRAPQPIVKFLATAKIPLPPPPTPSPAPKRPPPPRAPANEPLFVANAGLVVAAPFFGRYHKANGLLEEGRFKDDESAHRAVHLLQLLVSSDPDIPEHALTLNKVLCGLDPATPIAPAGEYTAQELQTATTMLRSVIDNWPKLGTLSIEGFRSSFLWRPGKLERGDDRWTLTVERRGLDALFTTIPWSFSVIKPLWMPEPLYVDWV